MFWKFIDNSMEKNKVDNEYMQLIHSIVVTKQYFRRNGLVCQLASWEMLKKDRLSDKI